MTTLASAAVEDFVSADPGALTGISEKWRRRGAQAAFIAERIRPVGDGWAGEAADAHRDRIRSIPVEVSEAAGALSSAVAVMDEWQASVTRARSRVADALELAGHAERQRRWFLENSEVMEAGLGSPLHDPASATFAEAEQALERAMVALEDEATVVESKLRGIADQLLGDFSVWDDMRHVAAGVVEGVESAASELWAMATMIHPVRLVTDMEGVWADGRAIGEGLAAAAVMAWNDPEEFVGDSVRDATGLDTLISEPARWAGELAPSAFGGLGWKVATRPVVAGGRAAQISHHLDTLHFDEDGAISVGVRAMRLGQVVATFQNRYFRVGNRQVILSKDDLRHILRRHHPGYWDESFTPQQTFVEHGADPHHLIRIVDEVLRQNRDLLTNKSSLAHGQVDGVVSGTPYRIGLRWGHVRQVYPIAEESR